MTTLWQNGTIIARRLRVRGSDLEPILTQQRITSLLKAANLHPTGLPPSTIVCIRKFRDPLPGKLPLQYGGLRPPSAWEQAATKALDQVVQRAVRPALRAVPATAEAVIFADQAELLACLARDWCEGSAVTHWWWQSLFKGIDIANTILLAWLETPEYIPVALQYLAEMRKVVAFVRSLSANNVRILLQSIIRSFALHKLQTAIESVLDEGNHMTGQPQEPTLQIINEQPTKGAASVSLTRSIHYRAPWHPWVPESEESGLQREQQCLLGIGLMLQRAPTVVRTHSFAQKLIQWDQAEKPADPGSALNAGANPGPAIIPERYPTTSSDARAAEGNSPETTSRESGLEEHSKVVETPDGVQTPPVPGPSLPPQQPGSELLPAVGQNRQAKEDHLSPATASPTPANNEIADAVSSPKVPIETALGGLFYLINVGLFLNLYSDFTSPTQAGIELSIWDFIALLGQRLIGEELQDDPAWCLLAKLAGRSEQEAPGMDFEPPESWRLPVEWLEPFAGEGTWYWSVDNGRLRVEHPGQILVLDLPLESGEPTQQLLRETQRYAGFAALERAGQPRTEWEHPDLPLARWLSWLMPYVPARLCLALDLENGEELPHILCEHLARVFVTAAHLDVVFSLDELPVEIRLAGLDRDPGWLPAAGRFIAFHFE